MDNVGYYGIYGLRARRQRLAFRVYRVWRGTWVKDTLRMVSDIPIHARKAWFHAAGNKAHTYTDIECSMNHRMSIKRSIRSSRFSSILHFQHSIMRRIPYTAQPLSIQSVQAQSDHGGNQVQPGRSSAVLNSAPHPFSRLHTLRPCLSRRFLSATRPFHPSGTAWYRIVY